MHPAPVTPESLRAELSNLIEFDPAKAAAGAADAVGATDIFVFRRIEGGRFAHLGGIGRAEGWAGIVETSFSDCSLAAQAYERKRPQRIASTEPRRIFGPYYAQGAVAVPVTADLVVVMGCQDRVLPSCCDELLVEAAAIVSEAVSSVSPAKKLADELEMLHALRRLNAVESTSTDAVLNHIVTTAADALSCEVGIVYVIDSEELGVSAPNGTLLDKNAVRAAVRKLSTSDAAVCEQDAGRRPLPGPLGPDDGVTSYYLLQIGRPATALMLLLHTDANPRGFTNLCQEIGAHLASSAADLIKAARSEEELRNAHKMEAIGRVAGGVAHDFNNILTIIHNSVAFAAESAGASFAGRSDLETALAATDRARGLVRQLMAFSRTQAVHPTELLVNELIETMRQPLRDSLPHNIELSLDLFPALWRVNLDEDHAGQIIANLAGNGGAAMSHGGTLSIRTFNVALDDHIVGAGRREPYVCLSIADTGVGMDSATKRQMYEPFFTTKHRAEASGLGLSAVHGIVAEAGGFIRCYSELGIGTTFNVYLPAVPAGDAVAGQSS
jgi:signal transduction histidine kinase